MKKQVLTVFMAGILTASMGMTALAGWEQEGNNWKYNDNGAYAANGWYWIDGNNDGIAESYYFDNAGILVRDTTVEGYTVNADGAWTVNGEIQTRTDVGVVQTQGVAVNNGNAATGGSNYDPAHPLAWQIDAWNLRLRKTSATAMGTMNVIGTWNVHAMLTGQMDMYEEPTGYGADEQKATEQELYAWFCNWLNGMDFANMSEMQRAQAIWDATKNCEYSIDNSSYKGDHFYDHTDAYRVLISRKGRCEEFAMTTMSLAKALGLKSSVYGSGDHAVAYVRVDGKIYESNNGLLFLNAPVTGEQVNYMYAPNFVWSSDY